MATLIAPFTAFVGQIQRLLRGGDPCVRVLGTPALLHTLKGQVYQVDLMDRRQRGEVLPIVETALAWETSAASPDAREDQRAPHVRRSGNAGETLRP